MTTPEELSCCICLGQLNNPIRLCGNEHYTCVSCVQPIIVQAALTYTMSKEGIPAVRWEHAIFSCPLCRESVTLTEIMSYQSRLIYTLLPEGLSAVPCDHCGWALSGQDRAKHTLVCKEQPVSCRYCQCLFLATEFNQHLTVCPAVPCRYCDAVVGAANLAEHWQRLHRPVEEGLLRKAVLFFSG